MAALKYWVWLTTLPGLTDHSKLLLLQHFSSPEDIYYADEEALWQVEGLKREQAALLNSKSLTAADRILSDCARKDIFLVTMADAMYPDRLRNIYQPPLLLYGKGAMPLFDEEAAVAVVGTRSCTPYGVHCAEKLGYELTQQGAMVVSGMARASTVRPCAARCGSAALPAVCWAAVWTWCTPPKTGVCTRISPPPACCCRSTRPGQSRRGGAFRCATAFSAA